MHCNIKENASTSKIVQNVQNVEPDFSEAARIRVKNSYYRVLSNNVHRLPTAARFAKIRSASKLRAGKHLQEYGKAIASIRTQP